MDKLHALASPVIVFYTCSILIENFVWFQNRSTRSQTACLDWSWIVWNHWTALISFASHAGLLGTLLISGLSYSTHRPERRLYPRRPSTLGPSKLLLAIILVVLNQTIWTKGYKSSDRKGRTKLSFSIRNFFSVRSDKPSHSVDWNNTKQHEQHKWLINCPITDTETWRSKIYNVFRHFFGFGLLNFWNV